MEATALSRAGGDTGGTLAALGEDAPGAKIMHAVERNVAAPTPVKEVSASTTASEAEICKGTMTEVDKVEEPCNAP
jgi:hypothetical protein